MNELLSIEVVYVTPSIIERIALQVQPDCTLHQAVHLSGLVLKYNLHLSPVVQIKEVLGDFIDEPLDLESQATELHPLYKLGVYGALKNGQDLVQSGYRIEILRPLTIEPKAARFHRVKLRQKQEQKWGRV